MASRLFAKPLKPEDAMPFGKFKGRAMKTVPKMYYRWLIEHGISNNAGSRVASYIRVCLPEIYNMEIKS